MVQVLDAAGAKGVAAVDQDAGDALTHVVAKATELADVEASGWIVKVQNGLSAWIHF